MGNATEIKTMLSMEFEMHLKSLLMFHFRFYTDDDDYFRMKSLTFTCSVSTSVFHIKSKVCNVDKVLIVIHLCSYL